MLCYESDQGGHPAAGGYAHAAASKAFQRDVPNVDKPAIQYIVEEARAPLHDILIITGPGKGALEDHFDRSRTRAMLCEKNKPSAFADVGHQFSGNILYFRQQDPAARPAVLLRQIALSETSPSPCSKGRRGARPHFATAELCEVMNKRGFRVGDKDVPLSQIMRYSSVKAAPDAKRRLARVDITKSPRPVRAFQPRHLGGGGADARHFPSSNRRARAGGEIQLTDAMRVLALRGQMAAVSYSGTRYDMGSKLGMIEATLAEGLSRADLRDDLAALICRFAASLR